MVGRLLLLIPTTTYRTHDFMEAAHALEVDVVVGSDRQQALEHLTRGKTLSVDFNDLPSAVEAIVKFNREFPLKAVLGVDDETVVLASMANEGLGLPHNSVDSVRSTRFKQLTRARLAMTSLPSPGFRCFSIGARASETAKSVPYPCVLKPVSLSASRGVIRADNADAFVVAFERICAIIASEKGRAPKANDQILVEDYIPGGEVALEGLLLDGELKVLALFDKPDPLEGPFFEETLYVTPSRLSPSLQEAIEQTTAEAASALGLRTGPVHAELRFNSEGVWIIEIAARSIGGLCSRVLKFGAGISLEELILRQVLGEDLEDLGRERSAAGVMMLPVPKKGTLRSIFGQEAALKVKGIQGVEITIPLDQEVEPLPEGDRYLGFMFAKGDTPEAVEDALREAQRRLGVLIE
jgi:biotin carboxylase